MKIDVNNYISVEIRFPENADFITAKALLDKANRIIRAAETDISGIRKPTITPLQPPTPEQKPKEETTTTRPYNGKGWTEEEENCLYKLITKQKTSHKDVAKILNKKFGKNRSAESVSTRFYKVRHDRNNKK